MDNPQQELIDNIFYELINLVDLGKLDKQSAIKVSNILKEACEEFGVELKNVSLLLK